MNHIKNSHQHGFTLLETLVALATVMIGVVGTLTLTTQSIIGGQASESEMTAQNLARESIEVAYAVRNSNWLAIEAGALQESEWDNGLSDGDDYSARSILDAMSGNWELDYSAEETIESCREFCIITYDANYSIYTHGSGDATPFARLVHTKPICENGNIKESGGTCQGGDGDKIGVQVLVTVEWIERQNTRTLQLEDRLYNWRQ